MFSNYFTIAFRNLFRHKTFSLINVLGLAIGMAACLLILQYVSFELGYDTFHQNKAHIYRIRNDKRKNTELIQQNVFTYPMVPVALKRDYPEVRDYVRIAPWIADHTILKYGDKILREKKLLFADASFFNVFSFPLIKGNPATALQHPMSVVLSESRARDFFGNEDPMGKTITFEVNKSFTVTGIFKDVPANSHLQFTMLVSYNTLVDWMKDYADSWTFDEEVYAYVLLSPKADVEKLNSSLADFSKRYYQGNKITGMQESFVLQPLADIHLYSHYQHELGRNGNAAATWGLLGVAVLIMVIAWCNYINLSTARYSERAKEIGIRKIVGASKKQLLTQFMFESFLVSFIGFLIALLLFVWLNPTFHNLVNIPVSNTVFGSVLGIPSWLMAFAICITGALLSGIYPAFILPSFNPTHVLKGKFRTSSSIITFQKTLVVYQFAVTISLIAFTWVAYRQVQFMMQKELGLHIEGTLVVWGPMGLEWNDGFEKRMQTFEDEISKLPHVKQASNSRNIPGDRLGKVYDIKIKGNNTLYPMSSTWASKSFFDLYGMKILVGSNFRPGKTNGRQLILNEAAIQLLGFENAKAAIGKQLQIWGEDSEIVGVVNNHHQQSLHNLVEPIMFQNGYGQDGYFSVKISNTDIHATVSQVESLYKDYFKGASFDFFFLEDYFNGQYQNEYLLNTVIRAFSFLAIAISCLGLWGLVLHSVKNRTKEIGIRKVLGASVPNIVGLLSKDFLKLIFIAFLIATPIAWFAISKWLEDFAYHIDMGMSVFLLAGSTALFIALLTISYQAIKAALANPVKSLRNE